MRLGLVDCGTGPDRLHAANDAADAVARDRAKAVVNQASSPTGSRV